jgi:hypothetical protein
VKNPQARGRSTLYRPSQVFRGPIHCFIDLDGIDLGLPLAAFFVNEAIDVDQAGTG